jgi:hypothetical protein
LQRERQKVNGGNSVFIKGKYCISVSKGTSPSIDKNEIVATY